MHQQGRSWKRGADYTVQNGLRFVPCDARLACWNNVKQPYMPVHTCLHRIHIGSKMEKHTRRGQRPHPSGGLEGSEIAEEHRGLPVRLQDFCAGSNAAVRRRVETWQRSTTCTHGLPSYSLFFWCACFIIK